MTVRQLFVTPDGALRSPWRVVLFLGVFIACSGVMWACLPAAEWVVDRLRLAPLQLDELGSALALLATHAIVLRIDRRPWSYVSLDRAAARPMWFVRGFAIGAVAIGIPVVALVGMGWLTRAPAAGYGYVGAAIRVSVVLVPAALSEELLMRGYLFSVARDGWGARGALMVTSVLFGLLHLENDGATVTSLAYVALAGVFLGGVLIATRSLYAAWMAHLAWNWVMAVVFHVAVSGWPLEAPGYRYVDAGPDWATGGTWGPEAGVPAGLGMIGALTYLYIRRRRRQET